MALIKCPECNNEISSFAAVCIYCGHPINEAEERLQHIICEECGYEILNNEEICPNCGCPLSSSTVKKEVPSDFSDNSVKTSTKKVLTAIPKDKIKCIVIGISVIVLIVIGIIIVNNNTLSGDDKIAYEMIVEIAPKFKDPSSVRLVSGCVGIDKDCLFCGLSGINGFGARTTSYYFIEDGELMESDNVDLLSWLYKNTDELNIEKINKKLEKTLRNKY